MINVLGSSDEVTTCERCGKSNLKLTVILDIDGDVVHYGADCAAQTIFSKKSFKDVVTKQAALINVIKKAFAKGIDATTIAKNVCTGYALVAKDPHTIAVYFTNTPTIVTDAH